MSLIIFKLLFITPMAVLGFSSDIIRPLIDYFEQENFKLLCLLTCSFQDIFWSHEFTKFAMNHSMKVSSLLIDEPTYKDHRLEKCLEQKLTTIGVIIDPKCQEFDDVLTTASRNMWLDSRHKWVIPTDVIKYIESGNINTTADSTQLVTANETDAAFPTVERLLNTLNLSVDADVSLLVKTGPFEYTIYEVYNFGKIQGGDLVIDLIGFWSQSDGLVRSKTGYKYYRRWDFDRLTMRMSIVFKVPQNSIDREMVTSERPVADMPDVTKRASIALHIISGIHNFRFEYSRAEVWVGKYDKNNSDKVVISGLYNKKHDISPLVRFLPNVIDHIDLAHPPPTFLESKFYYKIPTSGPGKFENQFLTPFSDGVWMCVSAVTFLCIVVLLLASMLEARPTWAQYAIFSVLAAFCQQMFEDNTTVRHASKAGKLTLFVTGLSSVLLYNYYTSSVVSWLLSGPPPSINSLSELMESPLDLILEDVGYSRSWVQLPGYYYFNTRNAKIEDELRHKKIYNVKRESSIYKTVEEGIKMVKAGGYAFGTESDNANRQISRTFTQLELCELGTLNLIEKAYLYPCLQKNSPYKEFFVWSLARLSERGIFSNIGRRTSSPPVACEGSAPRALALGGAAPAFVLLAAGYMLAVVILLVERFIHKMESPWKLRHRQTLR